MLIPTILLRRSQNIYYRTRKLVFGIMKGEIPEVRRVVQVGREKFGIELEPKMGN